MNAQMGLFLMILREVNFERVANEYEDAMKDNKINKYDKDQTICVRNFGEHSHKSIVRMEQ